MKHLSLIATVIPLVIVAIGLMGWVLSLRNDVTAAVEQINALQEKFTVMSEILADEHESRLESEIGLRHNLINTTSALSDRISLAESDLNVANDQMKTIMGDHAGFSETMQSLGMGGYVPGGERREYGNFSYR
jgi:hypothetical protein